MTARHGAVTGRGSSRVLLGYPSLPVGVTPHLEVLAVAARRAGLTHVQFGDSVVVAETRGGLRVELRSLADLTNPGR